MISFIPRQQGRLLAPLVVGALEASDIVGVERLLWSLPVDYPGGDVWLRRRLDDVLHGGARCTIARLGRQIVGVTIATPKPSATKLSTIYVHPCARRLGVGSTLLEEFLKASAPSSNELYVTVAHHKWLQLRPLLKTRGFTVVAQEKDRYGLGRHEIIATCLSR